jgi:hypothetical protein
MLGELSLFGGPSLAVASLAQPQVPGRLAKEGLRAPSIPASSRVESPPGRLLELVLQPVRRRHTSVESA